MKKTLKIVAVIIVALVVLPVCCFLFTGIPEYILTQVFIAPEASWPYSEWSHYDAGTLSDYQTISCGKTTVDIPKEMTEHFSKSGERFENHVVYEFDSAEGEGGTSYSVLVNRESAEEMPDLTDEDEMKGITQKDIDNYCKKRGLPPIRSSYDYFHTVYSADMKGCNILSKKNTTLYMIFMTFKAAGNGAYPEIYHFDSGDTIGFIIDYHEDNQYIADIYNKNDLNTEGIVAISAPDADTAYKIINSMRINTGE